MFSLYVRLNAIPDRVRDSEMGFSEDDTTAPEMARQGTNEHPTYTADHRRTTL